MGRLERGGVGGPMHAGELCELAQKAASCDAGDGDGEAVMAALLDLCAAESALAGAKAKLLERVEREEITVNDVGLKAGLWLARHGRLPRKASKAAVIRARVAVHSFEAMLNAAGDGEIRWGHVDYLCRKSNARNRDLLANAQQELIRWAKEISFESWCALVDQTARDADADGGYDPNDDPFANYLKTSPLLDGTREVKGRFVGEQAVMIETTLDEIADELFHQYRSDAEVDADLPIPGRDGGCIFPGCDMPAAHCDVHHPKRWADGGATDTNNGGLLCRHHHGITHRNGWTMTAVHKIPNDPNSPTTGFTWTTPTARPSTPNTTHPAGSRGRVGRLADPFGNQTRGFGDFVPHLPRALNRVEPCGHARLVLGVQLEEHITGGDAVAGP